MQTPAQTLTVSGIIENGFFIGLKNAASLLGAVALWLLTIWIPYINVGTTIGLLGLVAAMSRGKVISPTEIFRASYRKQMGEFFLVAAFMYFGIFIGIAFLVVPGIVIAMAWGLAPLLVIDQGLNPTEALQRSNNLTAGRKWKIFFGALLVSLMTNALVMLLSTLGMKIHAVVGVLLMAMGAVVSMAVGMGAQAHIYGTLTGVGSGEQGGMKPGVVVGGSLGIVAVSMLLLALIGGGTRSAEEDKYRRIAEEYERDLKAKTALDLNGDNADVINTAFEDPKPTQRDVGMAPTEKPSDKRRRNRQNQTR